MIKLELLNNYKSLHPFTIELPDFTILTGLNGAGKTNILEAISSQTLRVNDAEGKPFKGIMLHNTGNIALNDAEIATQDTVGRELDNAYMLYIGHAQQLLNVGGEEARQQHGPVNKGYIALYTKMAETYGKTVTSLSLDDFRDYLARTSDIGLISIFAQILSTIFKKYHDRKVQNGINTYFNTILKQDVEYIPEDQFISTYGVAPWILINEMLIGAGFDLEVNYPTSLKREDNFQVTLIDKTTKSLIRFSELSSGEKVIMALAFAVYNYESILQVPDLLLFDEPDASLHPSMSKEFLRVINDIFVGKFRFKVIMTTHSPSTVALAPEDCLHVVSKNGDGHIKRASKDEALSILTTGVPSFSVNYENRRQIFVESAYDVLFYEKLYNLYQSKLDPEVSLTFISSGNTKYNDNGIGIASCDQVQSITEIMRSAGNKFVWGIIDYDVKRNQGSDYVKVLGSGNRYNIESYLLDPILMSALLLRQKELSKTYFGMNEDESFTDFKAFSEERLQAISDKYIDLIRPEIKKLDDGISKATLLNGKVIGIPTWYVQYPGHKLEDDIIMKIWPGLKSIKKNQQELLKIAIIDFIVDEVPGLISNDIIELFKDLQK